MSMIEIQCFASKAPSLPGSNPLSKHRLTSGKGSVISQFSIQHLILELLHYTSNYYIQLQKRSVCFKSVAN